MAWLPKGSLEESAQLTPRDRTGHTESLLAGEEIIKCSVCSVWAAQAREDRWGETGEICITVKDRLLLSAPAHLCPFLKKCWVISVTSRTVWVLFFAFCFLVLSITCTMLLHASYTPGLQAELISTKIFSFAKITDLWLKPTYALGHSSGQRYQTPGLAILIHLDWEEGEWVFHMGTHAETTLSMC